VITVPCWHAHAIAAEGDTVLLRVTDEPLLAKVGLVKTG
jgi:gentisate 1,2-dioxygenase